MTNELLELVTVIERSKLLEPFKLIGDQRAQLLLRNNKVFFSVHLISFHVGVVGSE